MLHHILRSRTCTLRALSTTPPSAPLVGYVRLWSSEDAIGYGLPGADEGFAIKRAHGPVQPPGERFHVAFGAQSRSHVDEFFRVALAHGGRSNGGPGLRPEYGPNYYAAFISDPDGYRLEAVITQAE